MAIANSMDQYEKQLYTLFESYDTAHSGCLTRKNLTDLCDSLQLEERGRELVSLLLGDSFDAKVKFPEFRDGLLSVLGGEPSNKKPTKGLDRTDILSGEDSSGREVSPKYVFGSKKYGRRSRPSQLALSHDSETIQETDNSSLETFEREISVTSSVSHEKVLGNKKRRPNNKLRRSISFTGNKKHDTADLTDGCSTSNTSSLNDSEYEAQLKSQQASEYKCAQDISSNRVPADESSCLDFNSNARVNPNKGTEMFDNVGQVIKSQVCEVDLGDRLKKITDSERSTIASISTPRSSYCSVTEGSVAISTITDLWESVGVYQPFQLMSDLGFNGNSIMIPELLMVLEEEIRLMSNGTQETSVPNPLTNLLQAAMCLYQCELKTIKNNVNHTSAERDKLRNDLSDANQRAVLLALEVDDNHMKMENEAIRNIKQLEQKHSDHLKELSTQLLLEKEQSQITVMNMEQKICLLEGEEMKMKLHITSLESENAEYEKHINNLQEQLSELFEVKMQLSRDIKSLTSQKYHFAFKDNLSPNIETGILEERITQLQNEYTLLRDKNDELCEELQNCNTKGFNPIEKLTMSKPTCEVDIPSELLSSEEEGLSSPEDVPDGRIINGVKRRGDSPFQNVNLESEEQSPRICKYRRCQPNKPLNLGSETYDTSFIDGNLDKTDTVDTLVIRHLDSAEVDKIADVIKDAEVLSTIFIHSEIQSYYLMFYWLLKKIKYDIEVIVKKNVVAHKNILNLNISNLLTQITHEINEINLEDFVGKLLFTDTHLENQINEKLSINDNITKSDMDPIKLLNIKYKSNNDSSIAQLTLTIDELRNTIENERKKHTEEKLKDTEKYNELEASVELLKMEFDKCEDYWSTKLDEERDLFDQEQRISDEKFAQLLSKIAEYEEQFASQDNKNDRCDGPLSTIEEKYNLEKQFTDLEDEFEDYKLKTEEDINEKTIEISLLKKQIDNLKETENSNNNISITKPENVTTDADKSNVSLLNREGNNYSQLENLNSTQSSALKLSISVGQEQESIPQAPIGKCSEESTNICSPIDYLWNQSTIPSPLSNVRNIAENARDYQNPAFLKQQFMQNNENISEELRNNLKPIMPIQKPISPVNSIGSNHGSNKFPQPGPEGKMIHCSELEETLQGRRKEVQRLEATRARLDAEVRALNSQRTTPQHYFAQPGIKSTALEGRCRQLQAALRQQHSYAEAVMQQTMAAHRGEIGALRQRLAAADLLVRDLYVENCHLARSLTAPAPQ